MSGWGSCSSCSPLSRPSLFHLQAAQFSGWADSATACVTVLDLETVHPDARGFKRGDVSKLMRRRAFM